jgi:hypothetical protein
MQYTKLINLSYIFLIFIIAYIYALWAFVIRDSFISNFTFNIYMHIQYKLMIIYLNYQIIKIQQLMIKKIINSLKEYIKNAELLTNKSVMLNFN